MYTLGLPAWCSPHSRTSQSSDQNAFTSLNKLFFALSIILCIGALIASGLLFEKLGPCSFAIGGGGILIVILVTLGIYTRHTLDNRSLTETVKESHTADGTEEEAFWTSLNDDESQITTVINNDLGKRGWFGSERTLYFAYLVLQHKEIAIKLQLNPVDKFENLYYKSDSIDKLSKEIAYDIKNYQSNLVYDMTAGGNHSVLVYVDRKEKTIEYYDSMQQGDVGYGEYKKIEKKLKELATTFSYKFRPKTQNPEPLQKNGYQCGPWVLWFFKKRLEDPTYDFTTLKSAEAEVMIKKFRKEVLQQVKDMALKYTNLLKEELVGYTKHYGVANDWEMYYDARKQLSSMERWRRVIFENKIAPLSEFVQTV